MRKVVKRRFEHRLKHTIRLKRQVREQFLRKKIKSKKKSAQRSVLYRRRRLAAVLYRSAAVENVFTNRSQLIVQQTALLSSCPANRPSFVRFRASERENERKRKATIRVHSFSRLSPDILYSNNGQSPFVAETWLPPLLLESCYARSWSSIIFRHTAARLPLAPLL